MATNFLKMHGAGNDFVVLDARRATLPLTPAMISALADRRTGIGCDQLIVLEPPTRADAEVFMRIFNPDGSAAGACGNATRCVAEIVGQDAGMRRIAVQTVAGVLPAERLGGAMMTESERSRRYLNEMLPGGPMFRSLTPAPARRHRSGRTLG